MEKLRLPLFIAALAACGLCILVELGSSLLTAEAADAAALVAQSRKVAAEHDEELDDDQIQKIQSMSGGPPGRAIPALALVDRLLFYVVALYGLAFLISEAAHGRVRGILSLVVSILLLLTLTSLLGNLIIGFLHGLVPVFLKSILDSLAAIICAVLALIWSLYFLIPSLIGTLKAIKK